MGHTLHGNSVEKGEKNVGWWPEEEVELRKDGNFIKRKEPGEGGRRAGFLLEGPGKMAGESTQASCPHTVWKSVTFQKSSGVI